MTKKILLSLIFITLSAIAFLSGYLFMPEKELEQQIRQNFAPQNLDGQTGLITERFSNKVEVDPSEIKVPNTLPLSSRKFITFVNQFSDSEKIVAVANNGDIVEINSTNLTEKVVYTGQTSIIEALLSPAGNSVIYSFYDTGNTKKNIYLNFSAKGGKGESVDIPGNLKSAAFSPSGDQIAYLISNEDGGELLISKGVNIIKRAFKTRLGAAIVAWPSDFLSIISYSKDGYGDLFVLKENGAFNKTISYQYDLNARWSPSGEKIIFSAKNDNNSDVDPAKAGSLSANQLFYQDIKNNSTVVALKVNTNASKCAWVNEEKIICGLKNQVQLKDEFYKINLADGSKTLVSTPSINLLVKELALNRSGDILFALNDIDSKLYALKIVISDR
jgi:Tol biopolymer transport system component